MVNSEVQTTHPEHSTTSRASQVCEEHSSSATETPNPTASSSPVTQLLPVRTRTAEGTKKQPWSLQCQHTSSPRTCPEACMDGGLAGIAAPHSTWNHSVTCSEGRGKCCLRGRGEKEAQPQVCS